MVRVCYVDVALVSVSCSITKPCNLISDLSIYHELLFVELIKKGLWKTCSSNFHNSSA